MNIPNLFSILRIVLIPVFIGFSVQAQHQPNILAGLILAVLFLTDWLDGYLARRLNLTSDLGKILDPLADKLAFIILGIYLNRYFLFPRLLIILIIAREIVLLAIGLFLIKRSATIPISNRWGKLSTTLLVITFGFFYIRYLQWGMLTSYFFLICLVISSSLYLKNAISVLLHQSNSNFSSKEKTHQDYRHARYHEKSTHT